MSIKHTARCHHTASRKLSGRRTPRDDDAEHLGGPQIMLAGVQTGSTTPESFLPVSTKQSIRMSRDSVLLLPGTPTTECTCVFTHRSIHSPRLEATQMPTMGGRKMTFMVSWYNGNEKVQPHVTLGFIWSIGRDMHEHLLYKA